MKEHFVAALHHMACTHGLQYIVWFFTMATSLFRWVVTSLPSPLPSWFLLEAGNTSTPSLSHHYLTFCYHRSCSGYSVSGIVNESYNTGWASTRWIPGGACVYCVYTVCIPCVYVVVLASVLPSQDWECTVPSCAEHPPPAAHVTHMFAHACTHYAHRYRHLCRLPADGPPLPCAGQEPRIHGAASA